MPKAGKRILVTPLDWGLGHATRCVPIIHELLLRGYEVMIASSGTSGALLKREFPQLQHFSLPGYNPLYPTGAGMVGKMGVQLPKFIDVIWQERKAVNRLVKEHHIEVIISDNRYGCYSASAKSIFITHQLNILMPAAFKWMEGIVNAFNRKQIGKFDECWVPADNNELFPDLLKVTGNIKARYIGYLSRLNKMAEEPKYDILVIASGPSPQREIFAELLYEQLNSLNKQALLVKGGNGADNLKTTNNVTVVDLMATTELNKAVCESKLVVCRSGYSSVMDLMHLQKNAVFIPTPGQTEQEYVAKVLSEQDIAYSAPQQKFDLQKALKEAAHYTGFKNFEVNNTLLAKAVDSIL